MANIYIDVGHGKTGMNEEVRSMGYCIECGSQITDDLDDVYIDNDGNYLCGIECIAEYFGLKKMEF